jgi:AraC-like DNA-binding protein
VLQHSLKKPIISKITLAAFSIFLLCIIIPVTVFGSVSAYRYISEKTDSYMHTKSRQSLQITEAFKSQMNLMRSTSTLLLLSRWISRINNHISLYDDEFDLSKRLEIMEEIRARTQSLGFVQELFVVLPNEQIVVNDEGWFSFNDINNYYPYFKFPNEQGDDISQPQSGVSAQNNLLLLTYKGPASSPNECYIIMAMDTKRIERFIIAAALEQYTGFQVSKNDSVICAWGTMQSQDLRLNMYETDALPLGFHIKLYYAPYNLLENDNYYILSSVAMLTTLLSGLCIAALLAYVTTKPINRILSKLSQTRLLSEKQSYMKLPEYVDNMISNNSYMTMQLEHYGKIIRSEMLFRLLTDEAAAASSDEFLEELIPWRKEGLSYHVLLLIKRQMLSPTQEVEIATYLADVSTHNLHVSVPNCDAAYVLWYKNDAHLRISTSVQERFSDLWFHAFSVISNDFTKISALYAQAREQLDTRLIMGGQKPSVTISLSIEIELINAIHVNSPSQCLKILGKIWKTSNLEVTGEIMMLLIRLSNERFIYCQDFINRYNMQICMNQENTSRLIIQELCEYLCAEVNKAKTQNQWEMANLIQKYMKDNYCNSNLSLKLLADVFHINVSLLSRLYKAHFEKNFIDYLTEMRMDKAVELLTTSDLSISELCKQTGYDNYLSFKRAFIRLMGVSPRDYRDNFIKKKDII